MKKRFNKIILYFFIIIIVFIITFITLNNSNIKIKNKDIISFLLNQTINKNKQHTNMVTYTKKLIKNLYEKPTDYLLLNKNKLVKITPKIETITVDNINKEKNPIIYIYNTHQTEEYAASNLIEYSIKPNVTIINYILEEIFNNNGYTTLIEENSIKEILNKNNWNYNYSYVASRQLMEQRKTENSSLKYFIDVHRDSLPKAKTTTTINGKEYAKTLFVVGLENENYQQNLQFSETINNCLNQKYPTLSKGIYKKSGPGVNGVYNQDFSPTTILVEVGGYENTPIEVLNTSIAFSNCFMEVIKNDK